MFCSYTFDGDSDSGIAAHPKGVSFVHITIPPPIVNIYNFYVEMFKLNLASSSFCCSLCSLVLTGRTTSPPRPTRTSWKWADQVPT